MLCENFGDEFGINWFLPFKAGGFFGLVKQMSVVRNENEENINVSSKIKKN